jgi:hypothetical protein
VWGVGCPATAASVPWHPSASLDWIVLGGADWTGMRRLLPWGADLGSVIRSTPCSNVARTSSGLGAKGRRMVRAERPEGPLDKVVQRVLVLGPLLAPNGQHVAGQLQMHVLLGHAG